MMSADEENSQNEEGFIPNKIRIDSKIQLLEEEKKAEKPTDFQARYIIAEGVFMKEPIECYTMFDHFNNNQQQHHHFNRIHQHQHHNHKANFSNKKHISSQEEDVGTPYQLYICNKNYHLLFSRFKELSISVNQNVFAKHLISLKFLKSYDQSHFRILKSYQEETHQHSGEDLIFNSKFESGNLLCAFKNKSQQNSYVLFIQNDSNTSGYNQWFYFSLQNAVKNRRYKFQIVNLKKKFSFFKEGMRPTIFSLIDARSKGNGWSRKGQNVTYKTSKIVDPADENVCHYSLTFQIEFDHDNDYLTISSAMPYTYSRLINNLQIIEQNALKNGLQWQMTQVSYTLSNNQVPYITICKKIPSINTTTKGINTQLKKKSILILARQHAGQTWSSFLLEQFLTQLTKQESADSKWLAQNFIFKIFPMINIDGVIYGNFRCDLSGFDLNRCWKNPLRNLHPQIFDIKAEIEKINEVWPIQICYDFHGHSKDYNIFCYSCKTDNYQCRKLPYIMSKINPQYNFASCTFGISKEKLTTARAIIFQICRSVNTVTIQISTYGAKNKNNKVIQFDPYQMKKMAKTILEGTRCYLKKQKQSIGIEEELKKTIDELISTGKINQEEGSGSDSDPEGDEIDIQQKLQVILPNNFLLEEFQTKENLKKKMKKKKKVVKKISNLSKQLKALDKTSFETLEKESLSPLVQFFSLEQSNGNEKSKQSHQNRRTFMKTNQPLYKKLSKKSVNNSDSSEYYHLQMPKPLNLIEFSMKKLPIFSRSIISETPLRLDLNRKIGNSQTEEAILNKKHHNFDKTFSAYEAMVRPRSKLNEESKKIGFIHEQHKLEEQLPYLCILSENKKKFQFDRLKEIKEKRQQKAKKNYFKNNQIKPHDRNTILSNLKDRHNDNSELISRIWRENFNRYGKQIILKKDLKM